MPVLNESNPHEELPLRDEELGGRQRAEALVHRDEEERAEPEDTTQQTLWYTHFVSLSVCVCFTASTTGLLLQQYKY